MTTKRSVKFMRGCWQKKPYASMADAMCNAKRIGNSMLGAYRCQFCSTWHLGHWPKGKQMPLCHDGEDY